MPFIKSLTGVRLKTFALTLGVLALGGCAGGPPMRQPVSIAFDLARGGASVRCGDPLVGLGTAHTAATMHDARFYVSGLYLISADGGRVPVALDSNAWQGTEVALVDLSDGSGRCRQAGAVANAVVAGSAPAGVYSGVEFTVGVPEALNHTATETAAAPLNLQAMSWNWQAGRKFMKIEVDPEGGVAGTATMAANAAMGAARSPTWYVHLGSTGCKGNPATGEAMACANANRITVRLNNFRWQSDKVVLDIGTLLGESDLSRNMNGAVGCMSGPDDVECGPIFSAIGLKLEAVGGGGQLTPGTSPVFRAGRKS